MLWHPGKLLLKQRKRQFQNLGVVSVRIKSAPKSVLGIIGQLLVLDVQGKVRIQKCLIDGDVDATAQSIGTNGIKIP